MTSITCIGQASLVGDEMLTQDVLAHVAQRKKAGR